MGGPVGLDYTALQVVADAMGMKLTGGLLFGVRAMESEALKCMSEKNGRK